MTMVLVNYLLNECNLCWLSNLPPPIRMNFVVPMMQSHGQNHISMELLFVQSTNDSMMVPLNVKLVNWLSMLNACCTNDDVAVVAAVVVDLPKWMMQTMNLLNVNVMLVDLHLNDVLVNVDERPFHECYGPNAYVASLHFVLDSI